MDECGVFGFYNNNDIDSIALTHDALYGLQHRGQVPFQCYVPKVHIRMQHLSQCTTIPLTAG
jgi:glutamine phosphoribosylpyrophosphate amidotransferase